MSERSSDGSSPEPSARVAAIIVAGGAGIRMLSATGTRKQYADLLDRPVLAWAVEPFLQHPGIGPVVVVLPAEDAGSPPAWLAALPLTIVAGGDARSDSVRHGLDALPADTERVLVHDGARPFVTAALIDRVLEASMAGPVLPALRATDTLKQVDGDGRVVGTIDRSSVWHAQTPQAFPYDLLRAGHAEALAGGWSVTDDASLCERMGSVVHVVEGDPENLKITHPIDLEVARLLADRRLAAASDLTSQLRSG
jgi:2-C-methyl-D-erythritol 4-phosphate cytidylyltransferase